ncbi:MAG: hypothetical protein BMS9Abin02_1643 [Anaerolineae bacterium]|nr:MAG: hypothetical protein BMS9Abin02_1643 [Anaerolineae bacterium]
MIFIPVRRATLLVPSGPDHNPDQKHLFVLLTDPIGEKQEALLTGLASVRAGSYHDPTCILYPGDHDFIQRESYVNYQRARIEPIEALSRGVSDGLFIPKGTIDSGIFMRICQGLLDSRHAAEKMKRFYLGTTDA